MIKGKPKDNGTNEEAILRAIQDLNDRIDDLDSKRSSGDMARLFIANRIFDTDRSHLRELTGVPLRAVREFANADTVGSVLDPDVQSGQVTLGEIWRESHHRYMRSVKYNLLEKGKELAMEQARTEGHEVPGQEWDTGK